MSFVTSLRDNLEHLSDTMDEYHHDAQEAVHASDQKTMDQVNRIVGIVTEHAQREEAVLRELKASVAAVNAAYVETATNFGKLTATVDALPEKIAAALDTYNCQIPKLRRRFKDDNLVVVTNKKII